MNPTISGVLGARVSESGSYIIKILSVRAERFGCLSIKVLFKAGLRAIRIATVSGAGSGMWDSGNRKFNSGWGGGLIQRLRGCFMKE